MKWLSIPSAMSQHDTVWRMMVNQDEFIYSVVAEPPTNMLARSGNVQKLFETTAWYEREYKGVSFGLDQKMLVKPFRGAAFLFKCNTNHYGCSVSAIPRYLQIFILRSQIPDSLIPHVEYNWAKDNHSEQWKRGPWLFVGYFSGMKYCPVMWGLFHKPWQKDPY